MTRQELLDKIARYEKGLTNSQLGDGIKAKMRNDIEKMREELSQMDMKGDDEPKEEKKEAEKPSSPPASKYAGMSNEELESDIEDLKEGMKNPRMDASLKEKFKKQLAELEAEMSRRKSVKKTSAKPKPEKKAAAEKKPKPKAVTQKRAAQVKKQVKEAKKEVEVEKKAGKRGRPKKVVSAPKEAPKKVVKKRATKEVAKKIVKKVAAPKPAPKPVVKAAPKKPAKKKVTKEVAKKSVVVKAKPVVKVKKAEKKPVTKRKTKAEVKSQMPRGLSTFIKKDKEIRERYKGSTHDLGKDAKRGAKPFGWRLAGSNRRPTKADIKEGRAYWENRPERADVRRKEYPKLADGGMMAKGGHADMLKEDDFVWNALGKKLVVDKVTHDEYFLRGFMKPSASPFSKKKVHEYLKKGEWSLEPKMASGGMMAKGGVIDVVDKYNKLVLPKKVYSKGKVYEGDATFLNGFNGYSSSKDDGYLVDNDGNYLKDEEGRILRSKQRRGLTIKLADGGMMAKGGEINHQPIDFTTKNQTEVSAKNWLNSLIKERGRKEAEKIVRYNLSGKNQYYRFNNVYDTWLSSAINNQEYASGGMMADGGMSEMSEYEEAKQYLEFYHDAKIEREKDGVGYRVNYVYQGMENGGDSEEYLENASKEEIIGLAKKFGFEHEQGRGEYASGGMMAKGGGVDKKPKDKIKLNKIEDELSEIAWGERKESPTVIQEMQAEYLELWKKVHKTNSYPDLFERYILQTPTLRRKVKKWMRKYEQDEMDYEDTIKFKNDVESIGYTFSYDLSNEPYALRKIGIKLNQVRGFESETDDDD